MTNKFMKTDQSLARSETYILISLADKERHGYEIMKFVDTESNGKVRLAPGTLYVALKRLLESRLIIESGKREEKDNRERRYYRLSEKGRKMLGMELSHITMFLSLANVAKLVPRS